MQGFKNNFASYEARNHLSISNLRIKYKINTIHKVAFCRSNFIRMISTSCLCLPRYPWAWAFFALIIPGILAKCSVVFRGHNVNWDIARIKCWPRLKAKTQAVSALKFHKHQQTLGDYTSWTLIASDINESVQLHSHSICVDTRIKSRCNVENFTDKHISKVYHSDGEKTKSFESVKRHKNITLNLASYN